MYGTLPKINFTTYSLKIICEKFSEQIFLRMIHRYAFNSCFNGPLMPRHLTDLIYIWREIINKMRSLLTVRKILCLNFMTCVACSCRATDEEIQYDSDSSVLIVAIHLKMKMKSIQPF